MTRNAVLLLGARVASATTTLLMLAMIAHFRGAQALGLVAIGFALGQIMAVLSELGLTGYLLREASRRSEAALGLYGSILRVRMVTLPTALVCAWVVAGVASATEAETVWFAAAGLVVQAAAELARTLLLSQRRVATAAAYAIVENTAWVAVISASLLLGATTTLALASGASVLALSFVFGVVLVRATVPRQRRTAPRPMRSILSDAVPFAAYSLLATAQLRLDTILVSLLVPASGLVAAGAYFSSQRLLAAFEYVPESVGLSLMPEVSRAYQGDARRLGPILRRPALVLLILGVPIPFGLLFVGPWMFQVLFGESVGAFGWILAAMAWLTPVRFALVVMGTGLTGTNEQWRRAAAAGLALAAVASIDFLLLPKLGVVAAIIGSATGVLIVAAIYAHRVAGLIGQLWARGEVAITLAAACAGLGVGATVRSFGGDVAGGFAFGLTYSAAITAGLRWVRWLGTPSSPV